MNDSPKNVLFLCTGNSCRSIIAEALLNDLGGDRYRGFSAGSHPAGAVNPAALRALQRRSVGGQGFRSKNWDEFAIDGAPEMDIVITVCDNAAGEVCPIWPGQPISAHWGLADPAEFKGNDAETAAVFDATLRQLERLISEFLDLPEAKLNASELNQLM